SEVEFPFITAVFGAGRYNFQPIFYIGLRGEGIFSKKYKVGGALLLGVINPNSSVLKEAGFSNLLAKIGADNSKSNTAAPAGTFSGMYLGVYGDFPLYDISPCILDVNASGEVRFWYFQPNGGKVPIFGGYLRGAIYGTGLCLIHARGDLTLAIEQIRDNGKSVGKRECDDPNGCTAFTGDLWFAIGIGACSPKTWTSWDSKWWNDDWCWSSGARVFATYLNPPESGQEDWDVSFKVEAE
ncbi:MAG: hypothetical protein KAG66_17335, partial [Methylococcales bacterium]|nr:hypothetical protein [Methylococcales bacterium]